MISGRASAPNPRYPEISQQSFATLPDPTTELSFHLAQFNVARLVAPLESPELAAFVAALEPINALADKTPGFVWRLQTDEGDATSIRLFDDDMIIVNMSVWETVEALADFTYRSDHRVVMARRREFFEKPADLYLVLWWVPAGTVPTPEEGIARLERLRQDGPSPAAFTFKSPFPPPPEPGEMPSM